MHNISIVRGVTSHIHCVARAKLAHYNRHNLLPSYTNRRDWSTAVKLMCRASSNCSRSIEKFSATYQFGPESYVYGKTKTKTDCNKLQELKTTTVSAVSILFQKKSSNYTYDPLELLLKPVLPSPDDIQINDGGSVRCQDKNSVVTRFSVASILPIHTLSPNYELFCLETDKYPFRSEVMNMENNRTSDTVSTYVLNFSDVNVPSKPKDTRQSLGKPSDEQLAIAYETLNKELPEVFVRNLNFELYRKDIIFENRIRGTRTVGIMSYIRQAALLRILGHLKYAFVRFDILKITKHSEDGTIRVRWRIVGLSALKSFGIVWKLKSYDRKTTDKELSQWHDGFSVFYIDSDGFIYKHVADKMMPDEELGIVRKPSLATRIAVLLGLVPKTVAGQSAMAGNLKLSKENMSLSSTTDDIFSFVLGDSTDNNIKHHHHYYC